ncbi:hypothetical protein RchiOBHm_Chr2g0138811 [Rosa chinensis]|uniref:Uncharacterized protein n=1 Tax=Rosa chinensis TaxID=74649 RepID=A0A2P6RWY3_ROSCH|nr:hypothetical protein RchiOBHm_Chr2g0138811 [Rosa chinensis]
MWPPSPRRMRKPFSKFKATLLVFLGREIEDSNVFRLKFRAPGRSLFCMKLWQMGVMV